MLGVIDLARRRPMLMAGIALLLIVAVCAVGCKAPFPVAIEEATVPAVIRDSLYPTDTSQVGATLYSGIKWFVSEARSDSWLVASTANAFSKSSSGPSAGASSSTLMWRLSLWPDPSISMTEPRPLATMGGALAGQGTRPSDFQAKDSSILPGTDSGIICAGGIAFDRKIVEVVGVVVGDEVRTAPINGFWFMTHEGGTGWLEFRALDRNGKVLYTVQ